MKFLVPVATPNIKHSQTPSKININTLNACLPQFLLPDITCLAFNTKLKGMPKDKEKQSEEIKQASEPDLDMT